LIGWKIERSRSPDRPVQKPGARFVCVGIVVDEIGKENPSDRKTQTRDVDLAAKMGLVLLDGVLLTAEAKGLPNEQARGVIVRESKTRFLCFAIGKASKAKRSAESES
jgi:hypothetical protein